jgi:hypothetical protein
MRNELYASARPVMSRYDVPVNVEPPSHPLLASRNETLVALRIMTFFHCRQPSLHLSHVSAKTPCPSARGRQILAVVMREVLRG